MTNETARKAAAKRRQLATVQIKGRYSEAVLRVPSDIAIIIATIIALVNAGVIVLAIVAILAVVAIVMFA